jgi:hypothetical protein
VLEMNEETALPVDEVEPVEESAVSEETPEEELAACRRERRNGRSGKEICLKSQKIAVKVV